MGVMGSKARYSRRFGGDVLEVARLRVAVPSGSDELVVLVMEMACGQNVPLDQGLKSLLLQGHDCAHFGHGVSMASSASAASPPRASPAVAVFPHADERAFGS